ncbi:MAG: HDOD domain-containing protein [Pseudomonadota bacterium]
MFDILRRWFGATQQQPSALDDFRRLDAVAPLQAAQEKPASSGMQKATSFICREAILDRNERIAGYEFALGQRMRTRMMEVSAVIRRAYDDAVLCNLAPLGVSALLGGRTAFVHLSVESLQHPLLEAFAHTNTVFMLSPRPLAELDLAALRSSLERLSRLGIKVGWSIRQYRPELAAFLRMADYVELDASAFDGIQLKKLIAELRDANPAQRLIASRLQTEDEFRYCFERRLDFFKGPFVSSRENWRPVAGEVNHLPLFQALDMLQSGAEFEAIAECLRTDPVLTYKLLRYINSPGIGLLQRIDEIPQALILLGRDRFFRWLSLLLFDSRKPGYHANVIREQALTRSRFMEMLAGKGLVPENPDPLFLTGLFSLLHEMLGLTMQQVLQQVALPEAAASALRGEEGPLRHALSLAIALESMDEGVTLAAQRCGVEAVEVANMMIEALAWAQQIVSVND